MIRFETGLFFATSFAELCSNSDTKFLKPTPNENPMTKTIVIIILAALLGALSFAVFNQNMPNGLLGTPEETSTENSMPRTEQEFRDKLAEFRIDREKTLRGIVGLKERKQKILTSLRDKGVKNSSDLEGDLGGDTAVQFALQQFKSLTSDIKARQEDVKNYDDTIAGLMAMLADIDRQNVNDSAKMSEAQFIEGQKLIFALRDKLGVDKKDILEEQRIRDLLDSEIAKANGGSADTSEEKDEEARAEREN